MFDIKFTVNQTFHNAFPMVKPYTYSVHYYYLLLLLLLGPGHT